MRAVIVEVNKGFAAALTDDGCIEKVKNKNYQIGQVIEMKKSSGFKKAAVWAAAAAIFILAFSFGAYAQFAPYSYVSLDVNPSIELTLNRFDRVLTVKAVNDDGLEIIKDIDLKNKKVGTAIELAIEKITEAGFFDGEEEGGVVVSTSTGNLKRAEVLAEKLQKRIENKLKEKKREAVVEAVSVGKERIEEARELGVTPGKLRLVEKLKESVEDPDSVVVEEWVDKPVKEIMAAVNANRKANKANKRAERDAEKKGEDVQDEDASKVREKTESENDKADSEVPRDNSNNKENLKNNVRENVREKIDSKVSESPNSNDKSSSSNTLNKTEKNEENKKDEDVSKLPDSNASRKSDANNTAGQNDVKASEDTKEDVNKASNQNNAALTKNEQRSETFKADSKQNNTVGFVK